MQDTNGSDTLSTLTLEQAKDSILAYVAQGNSGHYNIGRLYNHIVDNDLARKSGYDSAQEFFSQHVKVLSKATLSLYGTVSREFSEPICVAYGMTLLGTLLTYEKAAGLRLPEGDPGQVPIEVPVEGGTVQSKPFADCSLDELKLALKHKRVPATPVSSSDAARVQFLRDSLMKHFAKSSRVSVSARVHRGKTLLSVQDVPLAELERFAEALLDGMQPVRAVG
ncbi:hypothetical protein JRI60_07395 [Archangium violaceum]|jgi:hypothetical protein|uniref:hypothetical protein n=1 Tax=Archangium violaceum TaxID=83451 RepID=UPI0019505EEF|nr:hypothetical protein [Archangium violaceum]QRN98846.1 hypothetical protein JRI60_07395 [Archangium violaceum]